MTTMDYNRVALFVRVVKTGSFTAAAAAVGLPKSSVSRNVSRLEEDLGVRLLQRSSRKLALTEAGRAYFDAVQGSVAAIDGADAAAREHGGAPRGTIRVTAPPDLSGLATALAQFTRTHPGIRVELTLTARFVDLVTEGFDLAVRAGRLEDSALVARKIGPTEMILVASPGYFRGRGRGRGRPETVAELVDHDFVLYRATGGRAPLHLTGPGGEKQTVEVAGSLVADDMGFCRTAVEAGAGIGLLPEHNVTGALGKKTLELVLPGWSSGGAALFVVLPTARQLPARVALLRDFLVDELGRQLAETEEQCRLAKRAPAERRRG